MPKETTRSSTARGKTRPRTSRTSIPSARLLRRGRSTIHGRGVYARVAIPAGRVIVEYTGERITKKKSERREALRVLRMRQGRDGATYIFDLNKRYDLDGRRGNISRFINHSCNPNCRAEQDRGRIWIIAKRDIAPGEEITYDYGFSLSDWADNPCRCGAPSCAGYIVGKSQRWRLRKRK